MTRSVLTDRERAIWDAAYGAATVRRYDRDEAVMLADDAVHDLRIYRLEHPHAGDAIDVEETATNNQRTKTP